jgi:hypothetical protein
MDQSCVGKTWAMVSDIQILLPRKTLFMLQIVNSKSFTCGTLQNCWMFLMFLISTSSNSSQTILQMSHGRNIKLLIDYETRIY